MDQRTLDRDIEVLQERILEAEEKKAAAEKEAREWSFKRDEWKRELEKIAKGASREVNAAMVQSAEESLKQLHLSQERMKNLEVLIQEKLNFVEAAEEQMKLFLQQCEKMLREMKEEPRKSWLKRLLGK